MPLLIFLTNKIWDEEVEFITETYVFIKKAINKTKKRSLTIVRDDDKMEKTINNTTKAINKLTDAYASMAKWYAFLMEAYNKMGKAYNKMTKTGNKTALERHFDEERGEIYNKWMIYLTSFDISGTINL